MPIINLLGVAGKLTSSINTFSSLATNVTKLGSAVSNVIPEISKLGDALPALGATLERAVSSIGTNIIGETAAAFPKMLDKLENLIPSTKDVQDLCESAAKKLEGGLAAIVPPGLKETIAKIEEEAKKVEEVAQEVVKQAKEELEQAPNKFQGLISEIDALATTLGDYASSVGKHIFNPDDPETPAPHFSQVIDSIKTDQLVTTANEIKNSAVDLAAGAVTATLYKAAGVLKEANLRGFTKTALYQGALLQLGKINEELRAEAGKSINRTKNSTPEQETGI